MKNRRQKEAGSLNTRIPTSTVPTAPMPVHTGYAVPSGIVFAAFVSSTMLSTQIAANAVYQRTALFPVARFPLPRQKAKPVSHSPASIKIIQSIIKIRCTNIRMFSSECICGHITKSAKTSITRVLADFVFGQIIFLVVFEAFLGRMRICHFCLSCLP